MQGQQRKAGGVLFGHSINFDQLVEAQLFAQACVSACVCQRLLNHTRLCVSAFIETHTGVCISIGTIMNCEPVKQYVTVLRNDRPRLGPICRTIAGVLFFAT
eukprot:scaffold23801_cov20-Tisochrysis_lutea.AAC.1